jgi:hypothetical protein
MILLWVERVSAPPRRSLAQKKKQEIEHDWLISQVVKISSPSSPDSDQTPDDFLHKDSNGDDSGDDTVTVNSEGDDTFYGDDRK